MKNLQRKNFNSGLITRSNDSSVGMAALNANIPAHQLVNRNSSCTKVILISNSYKLLKKWQTALLSQYQLEIKTNLPANLKLDNTHKLLILDCTMFANLLLSGASLITPSRKILLTGDIWPQDQQLQALLKGTSGFCSYSHGPDLLQKSVAKVLEGEIWIQRDWLQYIIGSVIQSISVTDTKKTLYKQLTSRELTVANLICLGKSNINIATALNISKSTVKAHLTSIYNKMQVNDRLGLIVCMRDIFDEI